MIRRDPGPCIVCGAAHCSCKAQSPVVQVIRQLPARDGVQTRALGAPQGIATPPIVQGEPFTTGTYRRTKKQRPR